MIIPGRRMAIKSLLNGITLTAGIIISRGSFHSIEILGNFQISSGFLMIRDCLMISQVLVAYETSQEQLWRCVAVWRADKEPKLQHRNYERLYTATFGR